jgi:hypothetical protein
LIQVNAARQERWNKVVTQSPEAKATPMTYEIRRFVLSTTIAVFAGFATIAVAQPISGSGPGGTSGPGYGMMGRGGSGPGYGMMGGGGGGMMGYAWNTGTYLESLKSQLKITAQQEPAWKEYADTVSSAGEQMRGLHQTVFDSMGTASWQERRDMMNRMFQARQQAYTMVHEAADKLLPALTPTQKSSAQSVLPGLAYGPGMMGRR